MLVRPKPVWRTAKIPCEVFHSVDVTANCAGSVVPTLEFVQHHLTESGHVDLLVAQTLYRPQDYSEAHAAAYARSGLVHTPLNEPQVGV